MSKNLTTNIIGKIKGHKLTMRPRWIFVIGSLLSMLGVILSATLSLLAFTLIRFRLTHPGIGASAKLAILIASLPWYISLLAILGLFGGYLLLKRYDFSYRRNFTLIIALIIAGLILGSYLLDRLGLDKFLTTRGYFRQIYNQSQQNNLVPLKAMVEKVR